MAGILHDHVSAGSEFMEREREMCGLRLEAWVTVPIGAGIVNLAISYSSLKVQRVFIGP